MIDYETESQKVLEKLDQENAWKKNLIRNDKRVIVNNIDNYILYLTESPEFKGRLKYNEFLQQKEIDGREFEDGDIADIYVACERELTLSSHTKIDTAISYVFNRNKYNPVKDYLQSLKWDGKERVEEIFIKLLNADDTELNRVMTLHWFMAAVKRVLEPSCKFDNMLVLQGEQGIGKSTLCNKLSKSFYTSVQFEEITNKDVIDKLNKSWIVIIDEMQDFKKKEMNTIKGFLSNEKDTTRLAYGRNMKTYKRHCVFLGSTNDSTFLKDSTSPVERRFWIIKCNKKTKADFKFNEILSDEYVDQIWAETYHKLMEDYNHFIDIPEYLQEEFASRQRQFKAFNDDEAIEYIKEILNKKYLINPNGTIELDDFYGQFTGMNKYDSVMEVQLNKVPMHYVHFILRKYFNCDRSTKYIQDAVSDEWEYKVIKWSGNQSAKGLYRKNSQNR